MIVLFVIHLVFSCSCSMISQNLKEGFLFESIFRSFELKSSPGLGMTSPCGLSSATVVTSLKRYGRGSFHESDTGVVQLSCLPLDQILPTIKSSYNTYTPQQISKKKIDCARHASQNATSHFNVISLIKHVMKPSIAVLHAHETAESSLCCMP